MKNIKIWTDGSCLGNPGKGGWAYRIVYASHCKEHAGGVAHSTNNRMELMAVIQALSALKEPCVVDIYTDSKYVQQGMMQWVPVWQKNNWRLSTGKAVLNKDLWVALYEQAQGHSISWHWVKGHHEDVDNARVDFLAREAAEKVE